MSDIAIGRAASGDATFRLRTVALMLAIGIIGFAGMLVLGAYAPDLRSSRNGGAHALSNAATGFSGLVQLAEATGRNPRIHRDERSYDSEDLLVLTPEDGATNVSGPWTARADKPTLFIFPKWSTVRDEDHDGWVQRSGLVSIDEPQGVLAPGRKLRIARRRSGGKPLVTDPDLPAAIRFRAARPLQVITGIDLSDAPRGPDGTAPTHVLHPLVTDGAGGIVVAQIGDGPLYVLADPDLLSNIGMKDAGQAASALALLDWLNASGAEGIDFDVTLNGFGRSPSPLRLAFEPPFLAMTLALVAALLLAGLHALGRFGPVRPRQRAIAFGKAALVDNSAAMVRKAGREARLGARYVAVVRDRAVRAFGVPARLRDEALDAYLDGLGGGGRFTELAEAMAVAEDRHGLVDAARALHDWQREKMR